MKNILIPFYFNEKQRENFRVMTAQKRLFGNLLIGRSNKDFWKRATGMRFYKTGGGRLIQLKSVIFMSRCKHYARNDRYAFIVQSMTFLK